MRTLIALLIVLLLLVAPAIAQDNPALDLNPLPNMNPADCAPVEAYYHAVASPWIGETWADYPPADAQWFDRHDYEDAGGVWQFRADSRPYMEFIFHFSKYDAKPPDENGGYPYTWGYHDVCLVLRPVHPLAWAFYKIDLMWQETYWAVKLPYIIN